MKKTHTNADMSHQNSIGYKIGEFFESLKINGISPTIYKIAQHIFYKLKGIDFSTQNLHNLTLTGDYKDHGTALVSTSKDFFKRVLCDLEEILEKKVEKNLFLDYGSGKGGAIIHARATQYFPPQEISVIYLFNPFDEVVMEKVAQNILSQKDKYENDPYIIYGNPSCDVLDKYFEFLGEREHKSGAIVRYYKLT